jgi:ATP-dependent Lon protease
MITRNEWEAQAAPAFKLPLRLPLLPLEDRVIFPNVVVPMVLTAGDFTELVERNLAENMLVVLGYPSGQAGGDAVNGNLFQTVGTLGQVLKFLRMKDSTIRLLIQGLRRVEVDEVRRTGRLNLCRPRAAVTPAADPPRIEALKRALLSTFHEMISLNPSLTEELRSASVLVGDTGELADFITSNIELPLEEKRLLISLLDPAERAQKVLDLLIRERNLLELDRQIQSRVKRELDKDQREYYLREQLNIIRRELGEDDTGRAELEDLSRRIAESGMSDEAREAAGRELSRLWRMPVSSAEYHVARTYLDWLIHLPWSRSDEDRLDILKVRGVLDKDHFGLEEVKERIVEYLAVRRLNRDSRGPILCLVGPPGVGKTSLGQSIARALGRRFCRISLGGIRDEAELRGHRRTYIGALPGRVIQQLRKAGASDPVIMLDELDKLGLDQRSDPAHALLEVLDPAQNHSFSDHYLEVGFDLSQVFFIATANLAQQIPDVLRDRLETIEIAGYTPAEKLQIARGHILPRQIRENGLEGSALRLTDEALSRIIEEYTREAGVRGLEREIATVARKTALRLIQGGAPGRVSHLDLADYLGPPKFRSETAGRKPEIGVATALAWTPCGGEILFIEALMMEGGKGLEITGQLGEVMKESALAACSFLRANHARLGIREDLFSTRDIHLHVPSGATPKDGPSAGAAMAVSLASLLRGVPVRCDLAMTGEITLRGKVLPVGGIREKVLAAQRAGIRTVILPAENSRDLENLPEEVTSRMEFIPVHTVDEVLEAALLREKE